MQRVQYRVDPGGTPEAQTIYDLVEVWLQNEIVSQRILSHYYYVTAIGSGGVYTDARIEVYYLDPATEEQVFEGEYYASSPRPVNTVYTINTSTPCHSSSSSTESGATTKTSCSCSESREINYGSSHPPLSLGQNKNGLVLDTSMQVLQLLVSNSFTTNSDGSELQLSSTGVIPDTYGSSSKYPIITVNKFGQITSVTEQAIAPSGVTSVGLTAPASLFTVTGSPVTTSGTLGLSLISQTANFVFAGPTFGASTSPTFRALVAADIPDLSGSYVKRDGTTPLLGNWDAGSWNITQQSNIVSGTGGNGYYQMFFQSANPSGVANYTTLWADNSGRLNWRLGTGAGSFIRTFDATGVTADRTYVLPNVSTTLVGRSGSNASSYISFFIDDSQISSDSLFTWNNTSKTLGVGSSASTTKRALFKGLGSSSTSQSIIEAQDSSSVVGWRLDDTRRVIFDEYAYWLPSASTQKGVFIGNSSSSMGGTYSLSGRAPIFLMPDTNISLSSTHNSITGSVYIGPTLTNLPTGSYNIMIGGIQNTAVALSGSNNVFIGGASSQSCGGATTGAATSNTGVGSTALGSLTSGINNAGFGDRSLRSITTGVDNTGIGYQSGISATGNYNTFLGSGAGYSLANNSYNVFIGYVPSSNSSVRGLSTPNSTDAGTIPSFLGDGSGNNSMVIGSEGIAYSGAALAIGSDIKGIIFGSGAWHFNAVTLKTYAISTSMPAAKQTAGGANNDNSIGSHLEIIAGVGRGTGTPGDIILSTGTKGSSGNTLQSRTTRVRVYGDTGNVVFSDGGIAFDSMESNSSTTGTVTMANNKRGIYLTGVVTALTLKTPASPIDGQECLICNATGIALTTLILTIQANTSQTLAFTQGTINAGEMLIIKYRSSDSKWYAR